MGIQREYVRLTPGELARARRDPEWFDGLVDERAQATSSGCASPASARYFSVDKSWAGIDFVLGQTGGPVGLIIGVEPLPTLDSRDYGPPRCLTPAQVASAATALTARPFADRVAAVDPAVARGSSLYEVDAWSSDDVRYVTGNGEDLIEFIAGAADAGDAVVAIQT